MSRRLHCGRHGHHLRHVSKGYAVWLLRSPVMHMGTNEVTGVAVWKGVGTQSRSTEEMLFHCLTALGATCLEVIRTLFTLQRCST